jgi:hypothetical protein
MRKLSIGIGIDKVLDDYNKRVTELRELGIKRTFTVDVFFPSEEDANSWDGSVVATHLEHHVNHPDDSFNVVSGVRNLPADIYVEDHDSQKELTDLENSERGWDDRSAKHWDMKHPDWGGTRHEQ